MDPNGIRLTEIERLVQENNRMLHDMRRNAFWGGIFKFLMYVFLFIILPWWIYQSYFAPIIGKVQTAAGQVQGVQNPLTGLQNFFKQFPTPAQGSGSAAN